MDPIKDQIAGKIEEVKGQAKEKVADVVNKTKAEAQAQAEKIAGAAQEKIGGTFKKVFGK